MFMNMSHFQPKAGQEAKFKEMFVDEVLSITLNAKGLISADIVVSTDGTITNLERWESEAAWKDLVADMTLATSSRDWSKSSGSHQLHHSRYLTRKAHTGLEKDSERKWHVQLKQHY